jgi:uncharacterized membrane protein
MRFPIRARWMAAALTLLVLAPAAPASAARAAGPVEYTVTDIGVFPGFDDIEASGINESGQIVGTLHRTTYPYGAEGFVWHPEFGLRSLGTLNGRSTGAAAINDNGEVVGSAGGLAWWDPGFGFVWFPAGFFRPLAAPPERRGAHPAAINNVREIAGNVDGLTLGWTREGAPELLGGLTPDGWGQALGINERGQVVGTSHDNPAGFFKRPIIWDAKNGLRELPTPPVTHSEGAARAINERGHVAGSVEQSDYTESAALWRDGKLTVIGRGEARALNDQDHVVGTHYANGARAQLYRDGTQIDLNTRIPAGTGIRLEYAVGINDRGMIVANGKNAQGQPRVYLLRRVGTA